MVVLFLTFILVFGFGIAHSNAQGLLLVIHIGVTPGKFMDQIGCPMVDSVQDKYPPHSTMITLAPLGCGFIFKDKQSSLSLFFSFPKSSEHRRKLCFKFQGTILSMGQCSLGLIMAQKGSGMRNVGH